MKVILINKQKKIDLDLVLFKKVSTYIANKFNYDKNAELNIIFAGKEQISELNQKFRKVDGPTDVLSFCYDNSITPKDLQENLTQEDLNKNYGFYVVGEVIICPEVALENIGKNNKTSSVNKKFIEDAFSSCFKEGKWDIAREIALLIIHGILHLYDYDHETNQDSEEMENIQKSLLNDVLMSYFS